MSGPIGALRYGSDVVTEVDSQLLQARWSVLVLNVSEVCKVERDRRCGLIADGDRPAARRMPKSEFVEDVRIGERHVRHHQIRMHQPGQYVGRDGTRDRDIVCAHHVEFGVRLQQGFLDEVRVSLPELTRGCGDVAYPLVAYWHDHEAGSAHWKPLPDRESRLPRSTSDGSRPCPASLTVAQRVEDITPKAVITCRHR